MKDETTHFGYESVASGDKARRVAGVFDSVAGRYDVMNDLMSLGLHRLWKTFAIEAAGLRPGGRILDVAGGTADLSLAIARRLGREAIADGRLWLSDINNAMLGRGRDRLLDHGFLVPAVQCNAERLPFPDADFDCVFCAFGLRNMTDKDAALREMTRVLRPGGRLLILEFSKIRPSLAPLYDLYSFKVLPWLGEKIAHDAPSYRYLAESIRMHPDQETLKRMLETAGLTRVEYFNLAAGVVALHRGSKP